jgi:hypothetical protein
MNKDIKTNKKHHHAWRLLLLCCMSPLLWAANPQPVCIQDICLVNDPLPQGYSNRLEKCPEPYMLSRQNLIWGAPGGWVSHDRSLTKNIQSFLGAQWQGVKLGQVICVYGGTSDQDFNVNLHQTTDLLVPQPHGRNWPNTNKNIINCQAKEQQVLHPKDCAFINKQPIAPQGDPTQRLDFFNQLKTITPAATP